MRTTNNVIAEYYAALPQSERISPKLAFIRRICDECGVSLTTAYNWALGKSVPHARYRAAVAGIVGKPAEELWPAEEKS